MAYFDAIFPVFAYFDCRRKKKPILCPGTDPNARHPKYEADVLTATPLLQFYLCILKLKSDKPQVFKLLEQSSKTAG
jgi:hypothetical protein